MAVVFPVPRLHHTMHKSIQGILYYSVPMYGVVFYTPIHAIEYILANTSSSHLVLPVRIALLGPSQLPRSPSGSAQFSSLPSNPAAVTTDCKDCYHAKVYAEQTPAIWVPRALLSRCRCFNMTKSTVHRHNSGPGSIGNGSVSAEIAG